MNMHTSLDPQDCGAALDAVGCLHDLLVTALAIIDELQLPGEIGAHLDMSINRLGDLIPEGGGDRTTAMLLG